MKLEGIHQSFMSSPEKVLVPPSLPSRDSTPPAGDDAEEQTPALVACHQKMLCVHRRASADGELIKNQPLMTTQLERRL